MAESFNAFQRVAVGWGEGSFVGTTGYSPFAPFAPDMSFVCQSVSSQSVSLPVRLFMSLSVFPTLSALNERIYTNRVLAENSCTFFFRHTAHVSVEVSHLYLIGENLVGNPNLNSTKNDI